MKLEFTPKIVEKMLKYQISRKFLQWKPSLCMREDGQTDMKIVAPFRNFANAPKTECEAPISLSLWRVLLYNGKGQRPNMIIAAG
jgi:hypothetical protein